MLPAAQAHCCTAVPLLVPPLAASTQSLLLVLTTWYQVLGLIPPLPLPDAGVVTETALEAAEVSPAVSVAVTV